MRKSTELIAEIENSNATAVQSTIRGVVFLNNGQQAFGNERSLSVPPGKSEVTWSFTLPTDWYAYPYTYEFDAHIDSGRNAGAASKTKSLRWSAPRLRNRGLDP